MRVPETEAEISAIGERFRNYLPVVIDVETSGLDSRNCALLELAWVLLHRAEDGTLRPRESHCVGIEPFPQAVIEPGALQVSGIDLDDSSREALPEKQALKRCFDSVRAEMKLQGCTRAIAVAHNAFFDREFVDYAARRQNIKRNPFHPFSTLDTSALAALAFGQTVLSVACDRAGIDFDKEQAHSARYDAEKAAELFCAIVNLWDKAYPELPGRD